MLWRHRHILHLFQRQLVRLTLVQVGDGRLANLCGDGSTGTQDVLEGAVIARVTGHAEIFFEFNPGNISTVGVRNPEIQKTALI